MAYTVKTVAKWYSRASQTSQKIKRTGTSLPRSYAYLFEEQLGLFLDNEYLFVLAEGHGHPRPQGKFFLAFLINFVCRATFVRLFGDRFFKYARENSSALESRVGHGSNKIINNFLNLEK